MSHTAALLSLLLFFMRLLVDEFSLSFEIKVQEKTKKIQNKHFFSDVERKAKWRSLQSNIYKSSQSPIDLMRIYSWIRKPHWLHTFKRGRIVERAFRSGHVSQRNEGLISINHNMSWSEVLLNNQRSALFCRTGDGNQRNN